MPARIHPLIIGALALTLHTVSWAQDDSRSILIEQGQYWQSRGDTVRATEAWEKLLRLDPDQADALNGMAQAALANKRMDTAQTYLARLRKAHPNDPKTGALAQAISLRSGSGQQDIEQARQLAQQGKAAAAVEKYRGAFGGTAPKGALALEYYQTLAGTPDGLAEAQKGLAQLAAESPNDPKIALARAQALTYAPSTRAEGIAQLTRLSTDARVAKAANDSWRQALMYLGATPGPQDLPLLQAYLNAHPDDSAIRERIAGANAAAPKAKEADPLAGRDAAAFRELDQGRISQAEASFRAILKQRPDDSDALGGLGILRLRQKNFDEAKTLLTRASRNSKDSRWAAALNSVNYQSLINQAQAAGNSGNLSLSRQLLEQASRLNTADSTAEVTLADMYAAQNQPAEAERLYRRALSRRDGKADTRAEQGLISVLAQQGKSGEAQQRIASQPASLQADTAYMSRLRASYAIGLARSAKAGGDPLAARKALEAAMSNDPNNAWIRLDLARLYLRDNRLQDARGLVEGNLLTHPQDVDALQTSAILAGEMQDWPHALELLDRVPANRRTPDLIALHRRAWINAQVMQATKLAMVGQRAQALALLGQAESQLGQDAELLGTVAQGYADAGQPAHAVGMLRNAIARSAQPSGDLLTQYAGILLKTNQDVEFATVVRELQNAPLSADQRATLEQFALLYNVRQADNLRQRNDLAGAYDTIAPLLASHPNDPRVLGALARMYASAKQNQQALDIYKRMLANNPGDLDTQLGAARVATGLKEFTFAESMVDQAMIQRPNNPEILGVAAQLYRAEGKRAKAAATLEAAIALQHGIQPPAMAGVAATAAAPESVAVSGNGNPFVGLPGQRRQMTSGGYASAGGSALPVAAPAGAYPVGGYPVSGYAQQGNAPSPGYVQAGAYGVPGAGPAPGDYAAGNDSAAGSAAGASTATVRGSRGKQTKGRSTNATSSRSASARQGDGYANGGDSYANGGGYANAGNGQSDAIYLAPAAGARPALPYPGAVPAGNAPVQPAYANGAPGNGTNPWAAGAAVAPAPNSMEQELADLQALRVPEVRQSLIGRTQSGEAGMGKVTEASIPAEIRFPAGDGRAIVQLTPVTISSGNLDTTTTTAETNNPPSRRFGGGAALSNPGGSPGNQSQSGFGVGVGYETDHVKADIGTTPLGFLYTSIVGGVKAHGDIGDSGANYSVNASRRPITESLMSFSGTTDDRTGQSWGGVTASGVRGQIGTQSADGVGFYGYAAYHDITGHNVLSNSRKELGGGAYWTILKDEDSELQSGLNLTSFFFANNQSNYTYGNGGYFSPQSFVALTVPMSWTQTTDRMTYQVKGAIGVHRFKEDDANYYPTNQSEQAAAATLGQAVYPGSTKTGISYSLAGSGEFQVSPKLYLGGAISIDNATDYRQLIGGVYMRYTFEPTKRLSPPAAPTPYGSTYGGD